MNKNKQLALLLAILGTVSTPMGNIQAQNLVTLVNNAPIEMIEVKGGTFTMGDHIKQNQDALPLHQVTLSDYYVGRTEVTQQLWTAVMGYNNSHFQGQYHPVENIEYEEIMTFLKKLNTMTGINFRLLTEAEWEYAARGGKESKGYVYSGSNNLSEVGWTGNTNPTVTTHNVANKAPNELGLYDMTGNVWEWCSDYNGPYSDKEETNPQGPKNKTWHQSKGGGYSHFAYFCQVCYRDLKYPSKKSNGLGFRLAMDASKSNIKGMQTANQWILTEEKVKEDVPRPSSQIVETAVIANPTKEQLVGVWQKCQANEEGGRKYGLAFKILGSDGSFKNVGLSNIKQLRYGFGGSGTWEIGDNCLVETLDTGSDNIFEGKKNAMEMTLSDNGNLLHLIYVMPTTGARVDEYFEKVK